MIEDRPLKHLTEAQLYAIIAENEALIERRKEEFYDRMMIEISTIRHLLERLVNHHVK